MKSAKCRIISYGLMRTSRMLLGLATNKLTAAVQFGARASIYDADTTSSELTAAQCIILALFHGLLNSDNNICQVLQQLFPKVEQLKSPYLVSWLRDDFQFRSLDVVKVLSNLVQLIRGKILVVPDYILHVFVGLSTKYGVVGKCKQDNDLETVYFLLLNSPTSRSQQTDPIAVVLGKDDDSVKKSDSSVLAQCSSTSYKSESSNHARAESGIYFKHVSRSTSPFDLNFEVQPKSQIICQQNPASTTNLPKEKKGGSTMKSESALLVDSFSNLNKSTPGSFNRGRPESKTSQYDRVRDKSRTKRGPSNEERVADKYTTKESLPNKALLSTSPFEFNFEDETKSKIMGQQTSASAINNRVRDKSRTRGGPHSKTLTHAKSSPNLAGLSMDIVHTSQEVIIVQEFLSRLGPVDISETWKYVNKRDRRGGTYPLHRAAREGLLAVVKGLLNLGAQVNSKDDDGLTPAHYAAQVGKIEILEVLKEYKADLLAIGDNGSTLLILAAWNNHSSTCDWLLNNGADIEARGFKGRTALHRAAMWGHVDTVRLLIARGASVHTLDYNQNTAFNLALAQGHNIIASILKVRM